MWPLGVDQLLEVLGPDLDAVPTGLSGSVSRAIGWDEPSLGSGDVFFALEPAHQAVARRALGRGAFVVVPRAWAEASERCLVAVHPLAAYRRLAGFLRARFTFPVVAVGGSNGKTTTKDMLTAALRAAGGRATSTPGTNNGWVGLPITLCHPAHREPAPDALALEIGIDKRGAMAEHVRLAAPDVAVLTALGPEHLAGLGSHEAAIAEELVLFAGAKRRVWLADDPVLGARLDEARAGDVVVTSDAARGFPAGVSVVEYAWRATSPVSGELTVRAGEESTSFVLPLPGAHNGRNAALAIATAWLLGRSLGPSGAALGAFQGPEQRCAVRRLSSGSFLVDDSYNASPWSVEAALDVLEGFEPTLARVVVLGDMLDLGPVAAGYHDALAARLAALGGAHVRLFGEEASALAPRLGTALASIGRSRPPADPADLLDVTSLERSVVLVKGSRGMSLERVVERVSARAGEAAAAGALHICVTGEGAVDVAAAVRARCLPRGVVVRALDHAELTEGATKERPIDVAVVTAIDLESDDIEQELALLAQAILDARPGGVVILPPETPGNAEALALLAGVVPAGVDVRRTSVPLAEGAVVEILAVVDTFRKRWAAAPSFD